MAPIGDTHRKSEATSSPLLAPAGRQVDERVQRSTVESQEEEETNTRTDFDPGSKEGRALEDTTAHPCPSCGNIRHEEHKASHPGSDRAQVELLNSTVQKLAESLNGLIDVIRRSEEQYQVDGTSRRRAAPQPSRYYEPIHNGPRPPPGFIYSEPSGHGPQIRTRFRNPESLDNERVVEESRYDSTEEFSRESRFGGHVDVEVAQPLPSQVPSASPEDEDEAELSTPSEKDVVHAGKPKVLYSADIYVNNFFGKPKKRENIKQHSPIKLKQTRRPGKAVEQFNGTLVNDESIIFEVQSYLVLEGPERRYIRNRHKVRPSYNSSTSYAYRYRGENHSDSDSDDVEVTLAPPMPDVDRNYYTYYEDVRSRRGPEVIPPYYAYPENRIAIKQPLEIRHDAGTVLTIHSPFIIRSIFLLSGSFPGLISEGKSLIIPEPFCAFLQFRDQLMTFCDSISDTSTQQSKIQGLNADVESVRSKFSSLSSDEAKQAGLHLSTLYSFLDPRYLQPVQREKMRWNQESPKCTFEWLWMLFPPGTLVYEAASQDVTSMRAYLVTGFSLDGLFSYTDKIPKVRHERLEPNADVSSDHSIQRIAITVSYLSHDGRMWTRNRRTFVMDPFDGEKLITELDIYQARYHHDPSSITQDRLVQRGRRYRALASRGQVDYHGETLSGVRRRVDSRIIIDCETYYYDARLAGIRSRSRRRSRSPVSLTSNMAVIGGDLGPRTYDRPESPILQEADPEDWPRPHEDDPNTNAKQSELAELSEESYMICCPEIYGYVLNEREWALLWVDSISDCVYDQHMIDDLQISSEARRLVQALSQNYAIGTNKKTSTTGYAGPSTSGPFSSDFVPNKGRGQILLLHGKPGVGKTTTAECIAELTRRPLLTITCGDLGSEAYIVEETLTRWLRLGSLWNAVLLFDEADVFLESRALGDIERNNIVSVFLRALEYYQSLIFLTTNRIGSFDEAILSRMHAVLHFPDLTDNDRAKIWDTSFRKLKRERPNIEIDFTLINYAYNDELIRQLDWNGREIRNAFNTMIALAEWDAEKNDRYTREGMIQVRREHLQEVAKMSGTFKKYMKSLRAMDEAEHVKSMGLRDDKFNQNDKG